MKYRAPAWDLCIISECVRNVTFALFEGNIVPEEELHPIDPSYTFILSLFHMSRVVASMQFICLFSPSPLFFPISVVIWNLHENFDHRQAFMHRGWKFNPSRMTQRSLPTWWKKKKKKRWTSAFRRCTFRSNFSLFHYQW